MQESLQTAQDIFHRNTHTNPFQIKIPSHNASQQNINVMAQAFVLNKLALLPFYQSEKLTQLYKLSLEFLINQSDERYKNEEFVLGIVTHLQNWQVSMSMFGVWPYTRASFYYIELRLKQNRECLERVMLRRGILEPNKQQFVNKSQNMDFKSENLKLLSKIFNKEAQAEKEETYELPQDILFIDSDQCWLQLQKMWDQRNITKQNAQDYVYEYENKGLHRFLTKNLRKDNIKEVLAKVRLRSNVSKKIIGSQSQKFLKIIEVLSAKQGK